MSAEFVVDTPVLGDSIGTCQGCSEAILAGGGIVVTADDGRWHPGCRATTVAAPKRRQKATA